MNVHTKVMGTRVLVREPDVADMKLINGFAKRELRPEEVYVAAMYLANDQVDRTFERFPISYLEQFAETIVGKSLLIGHDHRSAPEGLFFKAEVVREGDVTHLVPSFYVVKTRANEHMRAQIDGGVYRYVSIGFHYEDLVCDICASSIFDNGCPHVPGQEYEGVVCTATYSGKAEAVEGSIVYLGAQYGAELKKAHEDRDTRRIRALKETDERPETREQRPPESPPTLQSGPGGASAGEPASPACIDESMHSTSSGDGSMRSASPTVQGPLCEQDDEQNPVQEAAPAASELWSATTSLRSVVANPSADDSPLSNAGKKDPWEVVASLRTSLGVANKLLEDEKERARRLEPMARDGQRYRDKLHAEILRLASCVDRATEGRIVAEALIDADAETMEQVLADYQKLFDAKYPPRPYSTPAHETAMQQDPDPSEYR